MFFTERNAEHTIFLFSHDKAGQVINEFGQLILKTFSEQELLEYKREGCHIVGMVHDKKGETQEKHFPKGVYDYWPQYQAKHAKKSSMPKYLIEYFRNGAYILEESHETGEQIEWISKGLRRMVNLAKAEVYIPATGNSFGTLTRTLPDDRRYLFRSEVMKLIGITNFSKENWKLIKIILEDILQLFDSLANKKVSEFLQWREDVIITVPEDSNDKIILPNHYLYTDESTQREVDLEFGSIHSVKGRTHLATLVLETFLKTHNMKSILKYLCNTPPKKLGSSQKRLKCQYVAMTRARGLVCLAIPIDFVDEKTKEKLENVGWKLKIVK